MTAPARTDSFTLPVMHHSPAIPDAQQATAFHDRAAQTACDLRHRQVLSKAIHNYSLALGKGKARFLSYEQACAQAARVKREVVAHLDRYLCQFEDNFTQNGGQLHWARDADEARRIIVGIAQRAGVKHLVKSKSMASEEVRLNAALEAANITPIETDLGEFICQIRGEPPYHIVTPVMHLTKDDISATFHERLGLPKTDSAEELAQQARRLLREKFVSAVMGVTGGNFLVADIGAVAITENEGNARLSFSLPEIHVALVGIEKIIPRLEDLALFWPLLATSGTGQHITCYNSLVLGPRRPGEIDGPKECHVVLFDNGRTNLLADPEQRESLQCIRCGACLNVCPVFKNVGGHTYGTTYQGPIGSVITPQLKEFNHWKHLAYASSLCGRCAEACPVRIDIHHHLLRHRRNAVRAGYTGRGERLGMRLWRWCMLRPARYRWFRRLVRCGVWCFKKLGLEDRRYGNPIRGWTKTRILPSLADESFKDWWRRTGHDSTA